MASWLAKKHLDKGASRHKLIVCAFGSTGGLFFSFRLNPVKLFTCILRGLAGHVEYLVLWYEYDITTLSKQVTVP